ncbi:OmpA family protein [Gaoshiqia sp. Z1-71]|uniref:OmpA family protein n=1 Tax=Gaoshiqia hydrogeniformans TaxID=3290090 RepID=UPI003BF8EEEE
MKKRLLLVVLISFATIWGFAQENAGEASFNKWSIDAGIGLTKPYRNFDAGYYAATPDFLATEIGLRYMINEFFGLKFGFGYNQFTEGKNSLDFQTSEYRLDLQGVMNVGRVLQFENWTKTFNLLAHGGFGVGKMDYDLASDVDDYVGNVIGGLTAQVKLSPRVALNLDGSAFVNIRQQPSFNGNGPGNGKNLGTVFNGTVGLSIYLGKNKTHADWYLRGDEKYNALNSRVSALDSRVKAVEDESAKARDLAKTQGDVEELSKRVAALSDKEPGGGNYDEFVKKLVNDGYANIYFDFNSSVVKGANASTLGFIRTYLQKNPGAKLDVLGYADEIGPEDYNQKLSQRRADAAVKVLVESGIDGSRLNAVGKGEDTSVNKNSSEARQLARRVSFVVK